MSLSLWWENEEEVRERKLAFREYYFVLTSFKWILTPTFLDALLHPFSRWGNWGSMEHRSACKWQSQRLKPSVWNPVCQPTVTHSSCNCSSQCPAHPRKSIHICWMGGREGNTRIKGNWCLLSRVLVSVSFFEDNSSDYTVFLSLSWLPLSSTPALSLVFLTGPWQTLRFWKEPLVIVQTGCKVLYWGSAQHPWSPRCRTASCSWRGPWFRRAGGLFCRETD